MQARLVVNQATSAHGSECGGVVGEKHAFAGNMAAVQGLRRLAVSAAGDFGL